MEEWIPLVTGGGSGIGLGLVEEFLKRGSKKVLITGRRAAVLDAAVAKHPGKIFARQSDAGSALDRAALLAWVEAEHPDCNCLVNNAGIQRRVSGHDDTATPWAERQAEIDVNFGGPVHLCGLFAAFFVAKGTPCMIANVTSGLAFVPFVAGPVYSATKAALHNFTLSLRYSLSATQVRVVEIVPPAVKSDLGGSHAFGEDCDVFCAHVMGLVEAGEDEVAFNFSEEARQADRARIQEMTHTVAQMNHVQKY